MFLWFIEFFLVSAKFLFFSRIKSTIIVGYAIGPTWHKHELKNKNTSKQKVYGLFIPKQKQKQKTKKNWVASQQALSFNAPS